jgi:hypothetical protein
LLPSGRTQSERPPAAEGRARPWAHAAPGEDIPIDIDDGGGKGDGAVAGGASGSLDVLGAAGSVEKAPPKVTEGEKKKSGSSIGLLVAIGVTIAVAGVIAAIVVASNGSDEGKGAATPPASAGPRENTALPTPQSTVEIPSFGTPPAMASAAPTSTPAAVQPATASAAPASTPTAAPAASVSAAPSATTTAAPPITNKGPVKGGPKKGGSVFGGELEL